MFFRRLASMGASFDMDDVSTLDELAAEAEAVLYTILSFRTTHELPTIETGLKLTTLIVANASESTPSLCINT